MAATLTPAATTGLGVVFTASSAVFLEGDVGRQIIFQASRAVITGFGDSPGDTASPNDAVRADIIDPWPNTNVMLPGTWFLRGSPQSTLDPDKKGPVGVQVTLVADRPTFRMGDLGKFIVIYDGLVRITTISSVTTVLGEILSVMTSTTDDPPETPPGAWLLQVASWSEENGYPRTGEFYQGRLAQASTFAQPTTFWLSASDDYDNYAIGTLASDAIEYTITSRKINRIEWLADVSQLLSGTAGAIFKIEGQNQGGDPLGGDVIPNVKKVSDEGTSPIQPFGFSNKLVYFERGLKKMYIVDFDVNAFDLIANELTVFAEHILGKTGVRLLGVSKSQRPDPRLFIARRDGWFTVFTYFSQEKVVGFTRMFTTGWVESFATVPQAPASPDRTWTIVARVIKDHLGNSILKRYVEYFYDDVSEFTDREWTSLQTDCAKLYVGAPITIMTGLEHLEGLQVNVVADGSFRGVRTVSGGQIDLEDPASQVEVGLDYFSLLVSMRPAIEGSVIEGMPRQWDKLWLRVKDTVGGNLNNRQIRYPPSPTPGRPNVYTGDIPVTPQDGWNNDARIIASQTQPYPMTILAAFGTLTITDHD